MPPPRASRDASKRYSVVCSALALRGVAAAGRGWLSSRPCDILGEAAAAVAGLSRARGALPRQLVPHRASSDVLAARASSHRISHSVRLIVCLHGCFLHAQRLREVPGGGGWLPSRSPSELAPGSSKGEPPDLLHLQTGLHPYASPSAPRCPAAQQPSACGIALILQQVETQPTVRPAAGPPPRAELSPTPCSLLPVEAWCWTKLIRRGPGVGGACAVRLVRQDGGRSYRRGPYALRPDRTARRASRPRGVAEELHGGPHLALFAARR